MAKTNTLPTDKKNDEYDNDDNETSLGLGNSF
jgi:hypothetical protein